MPNGGERVGEATSNVEPWPHQIRAFQRLYGHWPPRLLIADEVGLGKTIQAGMLIRQAWLAGKARRVLILAPASVCRQWQLELREKFNLNWPIYDGDNLVWLGAGNHGEREHARQLLERRSHGAFEVSFEVLLHQVRDDFGVRLRFELVTFRLQLLLQRQVVFDDAVMHDYDIALAIAVRVSVLLGWTAVGGPTGVPDAEGAVHGIQLDCLLQVSELPLGAPDLKLIVGAIDCKSGRVVSPILEALQALQNDWDRPLCPDITNDSAHRVIIGDLGRLVVLGRTWSAWRPNGQTSRGTRPGTPRLPGWRARPGQSFRCPVGPSRV